MSSYILFTCIVIPISSSCFHRRSDGVTGVRTGYTREQPSAQCKSEAEARIMQFCYAYLLLSIIKGLWRHSVVLFLG